jgi:zinc protease
MALFAELRRRNVLKVALLYVVASWLILWFIKNTGQAFGLPVWTETFGLLLLAIGLPVALIFAWTYEITPAGLKKAEDVDQTQSIVYKTGQKLNAAVAVLLVLGLLALIGEGLMPKFEFLVPGVPNGDPPAAANVPADIRSLTLDNGLRIIAWPDRGTRGVVVYNVVRAGSRNERPGITGVSHFFERLMFSDATNLVPGEVVRTAASVGSANAAYTTNDVTVYTSRAPELEPVFELEASRLEGFVVDADTIESQRKVISGERRLSVDDNSVARLIEQMYATAFVAHPYQFPTIGWPSDIATWSAADLLEFFRRYYAPNNRTVIVVGDVTTEDVFRLAESYLAPLPAQLPPPPVTTVEPEQAGERRILIESGDPTPLLHIAFHALAAADADALSLKLLLDILVGDDSSRLHRVLVEEQQAALSVGGWQDEGFDPGLAYFYVALAPDRDPAEAESLIIEALQRIVADGVSQDELDNARKSLLAEYRRGLATIDGKASALAHFEIFVGGYENLFALPDALEAITPEDLKRVAEKIFRRQNMTVGIAAPPPGTAPVP